MPLPLGHLFSSWPFRAGNSNNTLSVSKDPQYFTPPLLSAALYGGVGGEISISRCICAGSRRNERAARENAVMTSTHSARAAIFPLNNFPHAAALAPSQLMGRWLAGWLAPGWSRLRPSQLAWLLAPPSSRSSLRVCPF